MPSTIEVRSFGSIRIQSLSNQRLTAANCARFRASPALAVRAALRHEVVRDAFRPSRSSSSSSRLDGLHPVSRFDNVPLEVVQFLVRQNSVDVHQHVQRAEHLLAAMYPVPQQGRVDRTFVNIEQRHVVVQRLVKQDDELDQVRVGLLPERLFTFAEQIVQQRRDAVRQRVGVKVVMERVVPEVGVEADLQVVLAAAVSVEQSRTLWQKSPFTSSTSPPAGMSGSSARKPRICSAYGYMQQLVFPEPIAPKIAMPVYRPRSGIASHCGVSTGSRFFG